MNDSHEDFTDQNKDNDTGIMGDTAPGNNSKEAGKTPEERDESGEMEVENTCEKKHKDT